MPLILKDDYVGGGITFTHVSKSQFDGYDIVYFECDFDILKVVQNDKSMRKHKIRSLFNSDECDNKYLLIIKELKKLKRKGKLGIIL